MSGIKITSDRYSDFVVKIMCTRGMLNAVDAQRFVRYSFSLLPEDEYRDDPRAEIKIVQKEFPVSANQSVQCQMELFNNVIIEALVKETGQLAGRIQFFVGLSDTKFTAEDIDRPNGIALFELFE